MSNQIRPTERIRCVTRHQRLYIMASTLQSFEQQVLAQAEGKLVAFYRNKASTQNPVRRFSWLQI